MAHLSLNMDTIFVLKAERGERPATQGGGGKKRFSGRVVVKRGSMKMD